MAIRLKDIARELNVSTMTVSKALREGSDISRATREKILKRMRELNYRPNLNARSLITGQTGIIGLVIPDILNPFFTEFAKALGTHLRERNYGLILAYSEEDPEVERSEIRNMFSRGVDALVLASSLSSRKDFGDLLPFEKPVLLIDRAIPRTGVSFVGVDDYKGGLLATEHLIQIGRRRIAYLGGPASMGKASRRAAYESALREHGLHVVTEYIVPTPLGSKASDETGFALMRNLLKLKEPPDAVFCHNDAIAIGAMKAILAAKLSIPGDIALVGFDNVSYSRYLQIPLTSIDQPTPHLGEMAARIAVEFAEGRAAEPQQILAEPALVIRDSSGHSAKDVAGSKSKKPRAV